MINKHQLRTLIEETLEEIGFYSPEATDLILGTIAQESDSGTYIKQLGNGPALGICQMEPATHKDIWKNYLAYKDSLSDKINKLTTDNSGIYGEEMRWNLKYAIAMCRVHYLRKKGAIPKTVEGQAKYWKDHYNTHLGKGTTEEYINNYNKYVK